MDTYANALRKYMTKTFYAYRREHDLSQIQMADLLEIDQRSYIDLERGRYLCQTRVFVLFMLRCVPDTARFAEDLREVIEKAESSERSSLAVEYFLSYKKQYTKELGWHTRYDIAAFDNREGRFSCILSNATADIALAERIIERLNQEQPEHSEAERIAREMLIASQGQEAIPR